jgi:hypothetical protein
MLLGFSRSRKEGAYTRFQTEKMGGEEKENEGGKTLSNVLHVARY